MNVLLTFGGFGNDWQKLEGKIKNTVYLGAWTSPYQKSVTGCTTGSNQDQSKRLELRKNLQGWRKWKFLVRDQTTKMTMVSIGSSPTT